MAAKLFGIKLDAINDNCYVHAFPDQIYSTRYWIIVDQEDGIKNALSLVEKVTKQKFNEDQTEKAKAMTAERHDPEGRQNVFIILNWDCSMNTVVHETIHAVNFVFEYHGYKIDQTNDEHQAYFTGFLADKAIGVVVQSNLLKAKNVKKSRSRKR